MSDFISPTALNWLEPDCGHGLQLFDLSLFIVMTWSRKKPVSFFSFSFFFFFFFLEAVLDFLGIAKQHAVVMSVSISVSIIFLYTSSSTQLQSTRDSTQDEEI